MDIVDWEILDYVARKYGDLPRDSVLLRRVHYLSNEPIVKFIE